MEIELKPGERLDELQRNGYRIRAVFVLEWMRCCSPDLQK